ncbi:virulence-associated E family protein [Halalkalibacterium halodurans]|uniref:virulence-associated E family protein n=1 Tax=Halalkalibacterium halodurans TaxID=86665 RepID=UPI002E233471|nr:virulence-associated E family protein [Halalkalibacterium halodurans]MED4086618.1 virulence-associated E family protein [Halalkalibacterium halodurans]MED4104520.1 virulence-associated E family protein [Halalkalibacterium halodurans]MED4110120.1 virulence-associated E family protein [Halalkalibacterium halodurans]MED4149764.1 virulence-associated E family protein [Halalkalibacterium halodurans]
MTQLAKKPHIHHDGSLTIAIGKSRKETSWKNREMLWSDLLGRLSQTTRTRETYAEYKKMSKRDQDKIKDVGGFVGGTLKGGRRKTEAVSWRQVVTLDADYIKGDLWSSVEMFYDFACAVYSTHKHSSQNPRLRLVIPLSRPVTPDEYSAISRKLADDIGIDFFDDTTYQPHRLMYWPSTSDDGEFVFKYQDEPWLDPDQVLAKYPDWTDPSYWPESSRQKQARKRLADKQGDPHEKPGMVGAFCRTYSIPEAIETFLADKYEELGDGRYTYREGSTTGGLVLYEDDKFAYSHHGTDPVGGLLVNSFDLVRIHLFGFQDEDVKDGTPTVKLPSYLAMMELTQKDGRVKRTIGEEKLAAANEDFADMPEVSNDWLESLEYRKNGTLLPSAKNLLLILENDPNLKGKIAYNSFSHRPVIRGDLPWRKMEEGENWQDRDDASLRNYLDSVYDLSGQSKINDALVEVQNKNRFHPIQDYLNGLMWDGIERLDTLLIDYLGANDTEYVRAVTRKMFLAAVARVMQPGIKFDNVLVMVGPQGLGKSYIVKKLGQKWHSDSISTVQGKEAYEQLQGSWLIELAELSATRKAEAEAVKHFISKQEDSYRVAYGRQTSVFPRQCVFFGTTNDYTFLKDKTGNRRFWPVVVGQHERVKSIWRDMDQHEINQIWAEAVEVWRAKESLFLGKELENVAKEIQEEHTEESEKFGLIQEYLNRPLPDSWTEMDLSERRAYIHGTDFGEMPEGTMSRDKVCAMEIWAELFNGDVKQLNPVQAREINDILRRMPKWKPHTGGRGRLYFGKLYGHQRAFIREMIE